MSTAAAGSGGAARRVGSATPTRASARDRRRGTEHTDEDSAVGAPGRGTGAKERPNPSEASRVGTDAACGGAARAVGKGDGDLVWAKVVADCAAGPPLPMYDGGKVEGGDFKPARWPLLPKGKYMWASVQTVRGCPKHCSFCSVWKTDGQRP